MKKIIAIGISFGFAFSLLGGCAVVAKPKVAPPMWGKAKKEYDIKKAQEKAEQDAKKAQEQKEQNK